MGRRARERKERREAGRERAMGASGSFMEDHDGHGGYIMARDGWRRRGRETVLYARQLKESREAAERAFHAEDRQARASDPDARAADELVDGMLAGAVPQALPPVGENPGE